MARMPLTFGVLILPERAWPDLRASFQVCESLGFDSTWTADHFTDPYHPAEDWFEGWGVLAAAAACTSSIRLGPLVSSITLRSPAVLAKQTTTLDHLSGGRFELGIGSGGAPTDYAMTGAGPWDARERRERLEEALPLVDRLLRGEEVTHSGDHYRLEGAVVRPAPVQRPRPPITLGGLGPRAIRLAARVADSWSSYGVAKGRSVEGALPEDEALEVARERNERLDRACEEGGRDPSDVRRSYLTFFGYTEALPSTAEFAAYVERFRAAGMNEFIVYWPKDPRDVSKLEAIAEILPELREL